MSGWLLVFLVAGAVWLGLDRIGGTGVIAVVAVLTVLLDALTFAIDREHYLADRNVAYRRWRAWRTVDFMAGRWVG
jgi:hypothetical protein